VKHRDFGRVLLPPRGPSPGLGQVVTAQQQVVRLSTRAASSGVPAGGDLAQSGMLTNPFDILPQRRRQFGESLEGGLAFVEENIVQAPQPVRNVGLRHALALDRDQLNRDQPLAEIRRMLDLPGAALGIHSRRRDDKENGVGAVDQGAEPGLPVFRGGNVMPVEKRREACEAEPCDKVFRQRGAVSAGVGDEDLQLLSRALDCVGHEFLAAAS
jgi:hypothetical protein